MPVKRSLKLDDLLKANSFDSSKIRRKISVTAYSPTTGTCQMSPFASPTSSKEQENKNGPSNGKRKNWNHLSITERKESTTQDNDDSPLRIYLRNFMEKRKMMKLNLKALEDSRELENLIGISHASCVLKREMQKTKDLMTKVTKQKLFEKKNSGLPNKDAYLSLLTTKKTAFFRNSPSKMNWKITWKRSFFDRSCQNFLIIELNQHPVLNASFLLQKIKNKTTPGSQDADIWAQ
ncbi:centromere protein R isoform X2 [Eschrichtius robustus]|uniref:centromere protein R isoform X2 n=1 Tax=Eschrichtius robustus TaxID=9764 RepID=UPI0035C26D06